MSNLTKYRIQLSDEILHTQICTVCKKYLSYPPTKVYSTGEIKCGRCSEENDFGVLSTFNKLTEGFLFPCVNSYEGCQHWLGYTEVPQHEETCKGGLYQCPFCPENNSKSESALYLIHHFKINHKKLILDSPIIQIIRGKDTRQHYFYHNFHSNLFALIFLQINNNTLFVNVSTVGKKTDSLKVRVKIIDSSPETFLSTSSWKACAPWNSNFDGINFNLKDDLNNFFVTFEFQNHNFMIRYVTDRPETNSLETKKEMHVPVVKTEPIEPKDKIIDRNNSNGDKSLLNSQMKTYRYHFWTEKDMIPKFDLDKLTDDCLKQSLINPVYSDCGKFIVNSKGEPVLDIRCSFCENYYATIPSGGGYNIVPCGGIGIRYCTYSLCNRCASMMVRHNCDRDGKPDYYSVPVVPNDLELNYFCRYSCGTSLLGRELAFHESRCRRNPFGCIDALGTMTFVRKNFQDHITLPSFYKLSTTNVFRFSFWYLFNLNNKPTYYLLCV